DLLPRVSRAIVERTAERDRPRVRWTASPPGPGTAKADALVVRLAWPKTREHVWTVVAAPATAPGLRLPALPDELAADRPGDAPITAAVALLDSSEFAGYDDVRRKGVGAAAEPLEEDVDGFLRWSATGELSF